MKSQFSIRDLLMIVAIFALAAGWWIDHQLASQNWVCSSGIIEEVALSGMMRN